MQPDGTEGAVEMETQNHVTLSMLIWLCMSSLLAAYGCSSECAERAIDVCTEGGECALVYANRVEQGCVAEVEPAACSEAGPRLCDEAIAIAEDARGDRWQLPSLCVPDGWKLVSYESFPPCE